MAVWKILTFVGLALNVIGVILLFFYVLPRRQRTTVPEGSLVNFFGRRNEELIKLERHWDRLSTIGLWSVIIGIALQAVGVWLAP